jgi:uncharacterized protein (DUF2164 family)
VSLDRDGYAFHFLDFCSRSLGNLFFGDRRRLSTHLGNVLVSQNAAWYHLIASGIVDLITLEQGHCFRNAGKL